MGNPITWYIRKQREYNRQHPGSSALGLKDHSNDPKIKTYSSAKDFERDALKLEAVGWHAKHIMHENKTVSASRTFTRTILTGGAGLLIGGRVYKGGEIVVTWHKE